MPDRTRRVVEVHQLPDTIRILDGGRLVASHAPLTLQATKEAVLRLRPPVPHDSNDLVLMCYMSEDFREGMDAFLKKRKPVWKGR